MIVPTRNRAHLTIDAARSIQRQTVANWELVIVDDGSNDDTWDRLSELAESDERITAIRHDSSRGAQAARNTGWRAGSGRWVAFLDSDDTYLPTSLQIRLDAQAVEGSGVIHSGALVQRGADEPVPLTVPPLAGRSYRQLLKSPGPLFPALMVERSLLNAIGGLDESLVAFQEWDTAIRLARLTDFSYVPDPTFIWNQRGTDTISQDQERSARGYAQVVRKHGRAMLYAGGPSVIGGHLLALAGLRRGDRPTLLVTTLALGGFCLSPGRWRDAAHLVIGRGPIAAAKRALHGIRRP